MLMHEKELHASTNPSDINLKEGLLDTWPIARMLAEETFADGFRTIKNLAEALPQSWTIMAKETVSYSCNILVHLLLTDNNQGRV